VKDIGRYSNESGRWMKTFQLYDLYLLHILLTNITSSSGGGVGYKFYKFVRGVPGIITRIDTHTSDMAFESLNPILFYFDITQVIHTSH